MGGHYVLINNGNVVLCCLQLTGTLPAYLSTMKVISEVSTLPGCDSRCGGSAVQTGCKFGRPLLHAWLSRHTVAEGFKRRGRLSTW